MDLEKAYDSISRLKLWHTLVNKCGVPAQVISCVKNMYYNSAALVDGNINSECRVEATQGVK